MSCLFHRSQLTLAHVKILIPSIVISALCMSFPLAYHARLHTPDFESGNLTNLDEAEEEDWSHVIFCIEDWQFGSEQVIDHSQIILGFQNILPPYIRKRYLI